MSSSYYVGVDLHKRSYHFSILDEEGLVVRRGNGRCDGEGINHLLRHISKQHHLVVEPVTNVYWFLDQVKECSGSVHLAHPLKVRLIAASRIKSDHYDSRVLADLLRVGYLPEAYVASPEIQDLRSLVHHRQQLVVDRTRTKNRIQNQFARHGILFSGTDPFGRRGRQQMEEADLDPITRYRVQEMLETLDGLTEKIERAERHLAEMTAGDVAVDLLQTIPGIGFVTAVAIRAITGDIDRFGDVKAYGAFTGLIPASRQSGDHDPAAGITHQGSTLLRTLLVQAAPKFMRYDRASMKLYTRLCYQGAAQKARVAVAHRLARIVYHVWKERRPFFADVEE